MLTCYYKWVGVFRNTITLDTQLEIILLTCYFVLYLWMPSRTVRKSPVGETGDVATTPLWRCTSTQHTRSIYGSNKPAFLFFSQCTKLYLAPLGLNMMPISFWEHRTRLRSAFGSRDNQANVNILVLEFHCQQRSKILQKSQNGRNQPMSILNFITYNIEAVKNSSTCL